MSVKGICKKGEYYDSVTLMRISKEINGLPGIIDSAVVMATNENKSLLKSSGLYLSDFDNSVDADLIISIKAETEKILEKSFVQVKKFFENIKKTNVSENYLPKSLEGSIKNFPDANLALISVAGKFAAAEAMKALQSGLNVMIFSDNVSVDDEIKLKKFAQEKGLLVMGPDCGTAIINGSPLAFANVVNRGDIGIVAASGTGLQEVSCVISNEGCGISQAIGTGGRDVKKDVGGIMFIESLKALSDDPETKVIVLISKPPDVEVLSKISSEIEKIDKPIVAIFIGGDAKILGKTKARVADNLEEAGVIAAFLSKGKNIDDVKNYFSNRSLSLSETAISLSKKCKGKYIRGLFSGGTLCDETQLILKNIIGNVYSNTPLDAKYKLKDSLKSIGNTIIDLGDDEFTVGRPHPMIDYTLRNQRILKEAEDSNTAVILFDVVLGYGSNMSPAEELIPAINKAKEISPNLLFICSITGTDKDPQNKNLVKSKLEDAGVIVMHSNAAASELTGKIIHSIKM